MIASLRLQNFRSYKDASFEFNEGVNIIIGPNASGKTNILEGLVYTATGTGFRAGDKENISQGADWARLDCLTTDNKNRVIKLRAQEDRIVKDIELDDQTRKRLRLEETIPLVIFEPNNLVQLTTSPEKRRDFIDRILGQTDKEFLKQSRDYQRTLAQRNRLLKEGLAQAQKSVFAWDIRLSDLAGQIVTKRQQLIKRFNKDLGDSYSQLAGKRHRADLEYISSTDDGEYASTMLKQLQSALRLDTIKGFTTVGPHRDDIRITINKTPIANHASRGETRTTLLALKTLETKLIEEARQQHPLLLLDDVFSELDGARRRALTEFVKDYQSFITTTDADVVSKAFTKSARLISLG